MFRGRSPVNRGVAAEEALIYVVLMRHLIYLLLLPALVSAAPQPNVILMMADDLGYADVACYGSKLIQTPVLDQMAEEGIRLTSFYAGATVCTPSRMALLTGAYPPRVGWQGGVMGYRMTGETGLASEALTMAEVFQKAGYRTGICGKWHVGMAEGMRPYEQGFDESFFIPMSNNQCKTIFRGEEIAVKPFVNRKLREIFAEESVAFIRRNKDRPFFLYVPWSAPHFPLEAHPDWEGSSKNKAFGDVVQELDARVGEIMAVLKELKLDENTLVVFTSDNGPQHNKKHNWSHATPFSGMKWSSLEGGNRVPCIARWPGKIPAGQVSDDIIGAIDLLPTLSGAAGIDLAAASTGKPVIDGVNVWATLAGKGTPHPRNDFIIWGGWGVPHAIRSGRYKLFVAKVKELEASQTGSVLYDLEADPGELTDIAGEHPDKVAAMKKQILDVIQDMDRNFLPLGGTSADEAPAMKRGEWLK